MRVKVLRAFCIAGVRQEPGTEISVPDSAGRELLQMGKVERVDPFAPASGPMTTTTAAPIVKGKAAKEKADVSE